jgi:HD-like signal output (HDOD) protein
MSILTMPPSAPAALDRLVEMTGELYTLPRVAVDVLELTRQPTVDCWKLKQCIEQDPALTAKLLRVVNSALFGLSRSVADLNQALAILGTKPLKLLVLGFSLPEGLFHDVAGEHLARYWQRTLIKAVSARELCTFVPRISGDEAFIAALLQDIGTLVLLQHLGQSYVRLLEMAETSGGDALLLQRRTLGFDHTQLSARLLSQWQLPEAIVAAAQLPRSSDEVLDSQPSLRQIVYLADLLSRVLLGPQTDALQELLDASRACTTLDEQQLARLVADLQNKVPQLAGVLSLKLPEKLDYSDLLARAYAQLAPIAGEAAAELIGVRRQAAMRQAEQAAESETGQRVRKRLSELGSGSPRRDDEEPDEIAARPRKGTFVDELVQQDDRLVGQLSSILASCRQRRAPLALLLVQLDRSEALTRQPSLALSQAVQGLNSICYGVDHAELHCHKLAPGCMAVVLAGCERQQAVRLGHQMFSAWQQFAENSHGTRLAGTSISIGLAAIAVLPRNFPPQDLLASAARCLSGAQSSGGNCLKSIEL